MLKANSKKAKENLKKLMVREVSGWDKDPETPQEAAYILAHDFIEAEKGPSGKIYLHQKESYQEAFYRWASGLTNNIFDSVFCGSACDLVAEVLEESEEEKARFSESKAEEFFCAILWIHGGVSKEFYKIYGF